ncbi:MAG: hypothetical protein HFJ34_01850 [Clostridia bacterium]|nr:hypothetical protein [Clostridia bacterium]
MENASKALLMAAGVLIGMLILSLAVYLFASFSSSMSQVYEKNEENQLNQFNTQFTSYMGKKCTIHDIITVANLATENNIFYELPKVNGGATGRDNYISVSYPTKGNIEFGYSLTTQNINGTYNGYIETEIRNLTTNLPQYNCTVQISPITKRVYQINFTKIP